MGPRDGGGRQGTPGGTWPPALSFTELAFKEDVAQWSPEGENASPQLLPCGVDSLEGATGGKKIMVKN